jgi:hypothetical protein
MVNTIPIEDVSKVIINDLGECSICMEPTDNQFIRLSCGHYIHPYCFNQLVQTHNQCPICRESLDINSADIELIVTKYQHCYNKYCTLILCLSGLCLLMSALILASGTLFWIQLFLPELQVETTINNVKLIHSSQFYELHYQYNQTQHVYNVNLKIELSNNPNLNAIRQLFLVKYANNNNIYSGSRGVWYHSPNDIILYVSYRHITAPLLGHIRDFALVCGLHALFLLMFAVYRIDTPIKPCGKRHYKRYTLMYV